jgi:hypothetical protein
VLPVIGVLAGLLAVVDTVPYVRDVLRRATQPHRGTWMIWSVLAIVAFWSQRADDASWSLIMVGTQAAATSVIFVLALRRGVGGVSTPERFLIGIAACGVLGWLIAGAPVVATLCVVVADGIGVALMLPKTYRDPASETLSTFALAGLEGALATVAVGALDPALLLYPAYYGVVNAGIAVLIVTRRQALAA